MQRNLLRYKKIIALFAIVFLCCNELVAQNLWSIQKKLQGIKNDTAGIRIMNDAADYFWAANENDSSHKYAVLALENANNLLATSAVKTDQQYARRCNILKARAMELVGSVITDNNINGSFDTLNIALALWKQTGEKTGIASTYRALGRIFDLQSNYTRSIEYYNAALILYQEINDVRNTALTLHKKALTQRYAGNFGDALESSMGSLGLARQVKDTGTITAALLSNGFLYMYVKDFAEADKNQQAALKIYIARHDSDGIATVYNDLGLTATRAGKNEEALQYHLNALTMRRKIHDKRGIIYSCNYISQIYQRQGKYEMALPYTLESLEYARTASTTNLIYTYRDAGNIYKGMQDYQQSLLYYDSVYQVSVKNKKTETQADGLSGIADVYLLQGKSGDAIIILQKAITVTDPSYYRGLLSIYKSLVKAYVKKGDYKNAFETRLKLKTASDSVIAMEKTTKVAGITNQLEYENRQALLKADQDKKSAVQQSEFRRQKLVKNLSIAGLLIVIILAVLFFKRYKEKKQLSNALENTLHDLKATQSQLIQSEKMASLGELTAGIAHEIQNPLNFVNNFSEVSAELIKEMVEEVDKGNTSEVKAIAGDLVQNLEKINYHGKRADAIVKGMLQHSRTSSGQKELTDINALCDEYLRLAYHGLRAKDQSFNATLKTDFDSSIGKIIIIPQDIGRVLLNLITNAFYAVNTRQTPPAGGGVAYVPTVSVSTKKANGKIEVKVSDNGTGIPKNIIDKIFQPFFTTKPTGQGTGLGLSLAYDIIKAHRGELKVETKENEGTIFIIQLPVV